MLIVYMPGVWDLLHVGHLSALEAASRLGDRLVVGVPTDQVVLEDKGSFPTIPLSDRLKMLGAIRFVDLVVAYSSLEFVTHLELFEPDIFCVGEDWGKEARHLEAEKWIKDHDKRMVKIPRYVGESTTSIKQRIRNRKC